MLRIQNFSTAINTTTTTATAVLINSIGLYYIIQPAKTSQNNPKPVKTTQSKPKQPKMSQRGLKRPKTTQNKAKRDSKKVKTSQKET